MNAIKLLLADDHAIARAGLRALLAAAEDMCVLGEAENGLQAVREAERLRPDVVLMDLAMPLLNGVEAARQIAAKAPAVRVLVLSSYHDEPHVRQALRAGVAGYLMKESAADDLLEAIRETSSGGAFFSPPLLNYLLQEWQGGPPEGRAAATMEASLTRRQAEVLQLIAEGFGTKQIADILSLSQKTIERHRQFLRNKLNLHNIASMTRYAVSSGRVESDRVPL
jgi:DNA-binding NarL/FixJ family response regulator